MFHKGGDGKPRGFGFGGFSLQKKRSGGSMEPQASQTGHAGLGMIPGMSGPQASGARGGYGHAHHLNLGKRRVRSEEEYFEDDDEDAGGGDLEYQPAPGSPGRTRSSAAADSDSDDPLDAFMAGIDKEVEKQDREQPGEESPDDKKGVRNDIDEEDDEESYYRYMEENPMAGILAEEEEELSVQYDDEGNAVIPDKKHIDPLPPVDHSEIDYASFTKNFFSEQDEIKALTIEQVNDLRLKLGIRVSGISPPKPVASFAHFGFDDALMSSIIKAGYTQPMPIQAQGVPIALSGRDIIGIAKTGSGKTAAFLWPLLVHIMDQKELQPGDGPIGLICAPTRELSQQIYQEAKKFGKVYNIKVVCAYGGGNMWEQCNACAEGAEIIVATPGRLIDLVKKKAVKFNRVTYMVFDEADRMFDMGFEPQVRSIANHVRPDRQTLMFSATFRKRVERVARAILSDPIRVVQGDVGEANQDVVQIVKVVGPGPQKWNWLMSHLVEFTTVGSVLIFVTRKLNSEELATNLDKKDMKVGLLHGDMDQTERNQVISAFKKKEMPILVATDVAARGLDITHIRTVVNYDVARDIDTHTHRIGRTGRAGEKGWAYTLITGKDKEFAGHLVRNLEGANQQVPADLMNLAMQVPWFKQSRFRQQKAKRLNISQGLGYRERPGLGATTATSTNPSELMKVVTRFNPKGSSGPQSDRVANMKMAFKSQFTTQFVSAAVQEEHRQYSSPKIGEEHLSESKKKKSRWSS